MTADTAAWKDEQPVKGLDSLFAPFSILPRQRAVSAKPTRREQQIVWISHGIPTAVWTVRQENVQETLAGFRLPLRHGQSMASALREFAHYPFLILSRENRRTRALATAMDVVGVAEFSGFVSAVVELFRQGAVPIRHRTDLGKQKRQE